MELGWGYFGGISVLIQDNPRRHHQGGATEPRINDLFLEHSKRGVSLFTLQLCATPGTRPVVNAKSLCTSGFSPEKTSST